jgi:hypothetical protein
MKTILIMTGLLLFIAGNSQAGSQYDACIKQEKALKAKAASDCSGLRYLLDPSSCFKKRKELKEYTDGKCSALSAGGQIDVSPPKAAPEQKSAGTPQKPAEMTPAVATPETNAGDRVSAPPQKPEVKASPPTAAAPQRQPAVPAEPAAEAICDQIKTENGRLKTENSRLRSEIEQLRRALPR